MTTDEGGLAQWAIEGVLLSNDLAPLVLAPLQLEDGAAAAVCSLWKTSWRATSEGRKRLVRVAFDFPQDLLGKDHPVEMTVIPGDGEQLVVSSGCTTRILDRSMSTVLSFKSDDSLGVFAADEQSIYAIARGAHARLTHSGTEVTSYDDDDDYEGYCPVLAPGGLLFCVRYEADDDYQLDEILCLDAQSLQIRHRFGLSLLNDARGLAVIGEELFVCDRKNDRLQVFSLDGEHRRSITGEWKRPSGLCFVKDRLYLVEQNCVGDNEQHEDDGRYDPLCGRRIFALSLQGDVLQVYPIPVEENRFHRFSGSLCYFDGKLLASYVDNTESPAGIVALLLRPL